MTLQRDSSITLMLLCRMLLLLFLLGTELSRGSSRGGRFGNPLRFEDTANGLAMSSGRGGVLWSLNHKWKLSGVCPSYLSARCTALRLSKTEIFYNALFVNVNAIMQGIHVCRKAKMHALSAPVSKATWVSIDCQERMSHAMTSTSQLPAKRTEQ